MSNWSWGWADNTRGWTYERRDWGRDGGEWREGRETLKEAGIIENDTRSTKDCLNSGF